MTNFFVLFYDGIYRRLNCIMLLIGIIWHTLWNRERKLTLGNYQIISRWSTTANVQGYRMGYQVYINKTHLVGQLFPIWILMLLSSSLWDIKETLFLFFTLSAQKYTDLWWLHIPAHNKNIIQIQMKRKQIADNYSKTLMEILLLDMDIQVEFDDLAHWPKNLRFQYLQELLQPPRQCE